MEDILSAVKILKKGGVVAYPGDTCYMLGANIYNDRAIARVMQARGLAAGEAPLPVAVDSLSQAEDIVQLGSDHREIIENIWPGPILFYLPKKASVSSMLSGPSNLIGLVQFKNATARRLIYRAGFPITAVPANPLNRSEVTNPKLVVADNDLALKDVCAYSGKEMTVVDLFNGRIVEEGVWGERIEKILFS